MKHFTISLFVFAILLYSSVSYGQNPINKQRSAYYGYIYKITNKEAKKIYRWDTWIVDNSCFHTLTDSFPANSQYLKQLPVGHYLKVRIINDELKLEILTVRNFNFYILKNHTDLCIAVYDSTGNIITDAVVKIRGIPIRYDKKSKSYRKKKSNKCGLLSVEYDEIKAFCRLDRQYWNPAVRRISQKVIYKTPLKYAWKPVRWVIMLPVDGVRSIIDRNPRGQIYRIRYSFGRILNKIACWFDKSYRDQSDYNYKGYLVFNKPKYIPDDTVKLKAFLLNRRGKTLTTPLIVSLEKSCDDLIILDTINPYRDGAYSYEFTINDSLNLQLDKSYSVKLFTKRNKHIINNRFYFEEYELFENKLNVGLSNNEQFKNRDFRISLKATDENEMPVPDARVEILINPLAIHSYFADSTFIPDSLWYHNQKLDENGEASVIIPDSGFPPVNMTCNINVRMLTSDNETISESEKVEYYHQSEKMDYESVNGFLHLTYRENGIKSPVEATVRGYDKFNNLLYESEIQLPDSVKINPYIYRYSVDNKKNTTNIFPGKESKLVQCYAERTKDSLFIRINNPHKIPVNYFLYNGNREVIRKQATETDLKMKCRPAKTYFISLHYLWGGRMFNLDYSIPFNRNKLNIKVKQPKIIYPGMESKIEIEVTDIKQKPVEGVDITAYSLTRKFDYSPPKLPAFNKKHQNRATVNDFSIRQKTINNYGKFLDYNFWKNKTGIDSLEYYKFRYPGTHLYLSSFIPDDSITQFAPFFMSNYFGNPVKVIYLNNHPVYFSWTNP